MPGLVLKPSHKPVRNYYAALQHLAAQGATHEGAVKTAFQGLLEACASQRQWTLLGEYEIRRPGQHPLRVDAALRDNFWITHGYWEAKDSADDLEQEARKKFAAGWPKQNIR